MSIGNIGPMPSPPVGGIYQALTPEADRGPRAMTLRERLDSRRRSILAQLVEVDTALALLESRPELEQLWGSLRALHEVY